MFFSKRFKKIEDALETVRNNLIDHSSFTRGLVQKTHDKVEKFLYDHAPTRGESLRQSIETVWTSIDSIIEQQELIRKELKALSNLVNPAPEVSPDTTPSTQEPPALESSTESATDGVKDGM